MKGLLVYWKHKELPFRNIVIPGTMVITAVLLPPLVGQLVIFLENANLMT